MQVFVSEYLCGGGCPADDMTKSLFGEGAAMLVALCEDLAKLPNVDVVTTQGVATTRGNTDAHDARQTLELPPAVHVVSVTSVEEESTRFLGLSAAADVTFVIAPELDDQLAHRIAAAREVGAHVIAPTIETVRLCSDKLRLAPFLIDRGISTIPTTPLITDDRRLTGNDPLGDGSFDDGPLVVKRRFGAGSQDVHLVETREQVERFRCPSSTPEVEQFIVQPFVRGRDVSVGVILRPVSRPETQLCEEEAFRDVLPVADQRLSRDGQFRYLGGRIPADLPQRDRDKVRQLVIDCCRLFPHMAGYVGFDLVVPESLSLAPQLVEINPRLCTSYLGYRAMTTDNLAARLLPAEMTTSLHWHPHAVTFNPEGVIE